MQVMNNNINNISVYISTAEMLSKRFVIPNKVYRILIPGILICI
jgi:hypothetical protein